MQTPLSSDEVTDLRSQTPGTESVVHMNHAGSSLPPQSVIDAQIGHLQREAETGGYEAAGERAADDDAVYASIASLIGAQPKEIARVEHATTAWNAAFWSVSMEPGQRILTAEAAYGANAIGFMRARERRGISIEVVPSDSTGQIDLDALERSVDDDVALIALTHVPTNGGLVNPAAAVGRIARSVGVPFLLDACQSVGQLDIDVEALGCDLLSATGRKYLRGPRGTGFLYASDRIIDTLHPDHPDHHGAHWDRPDGYTLSAGAARFEHWEYSHASWLGLGPAVELATSIGMGRVEATIRQQAARLRKQLHEAGCETFDLGEQPCGIVTTTVAGRDPAAVKAALREQHINVSVSSPSSTLWDATRRQLQPMLRVSVHYLTTDDEIDQTVEALKNQR